MKADSSFGTRRALQGRSLYKILDEMFNKYLPKLQVRPVVDIRESQPKPVLVQVSIMNNQPSIKFRFTSESISDLPEVESNVREKIKPEMEKLAKIFSNC
jgi:hypothetical protein